MVTCFFFLKSKNASFSIVNSSWPCYAMGPYFLLPQLCLLVVHLGALAKMVVCFEVFQTYLHSLKHKSIVQLNICTVGLF